jgi:hypothetical protein
MKSAQLEFVEATREELGKVTAVVSRGLDLLKETRDLLYSKNWPVPRNAKDWEFGGPEDFFKLSENVSAAMDLAIHALERSRTVSSQCSKMGTRLREVYAELDAEEAAARHDYPKEKEEK